MRSRTRVKRNHRSRIEESIPSRNVSGQWMLGLFLVLKPFYLWSSGLPQIADFVLLALITHQFFVRVRNPNASPVWKPFQLIAVLFLYWSTLVNLAAALFVGEVASFVTACAMNGYNIAVALTIFGMFRNSPQAVAKALYIGGLASILIQAALILGGTVSSGLRATGTFNNPNQLAFHSVLIIALLLISHEFLRPTTVAWTCVGIILSCFCVALSLSRGGAVAAIILLIGLTMMPPASGAKKWKFRGVVISLTIAFLLFLRTVQDPAIVAWIDAFVGRASKQDPSGFEASRGYDRVFDYPEYWFFGAGEGAYWRFNAWNEFHSTLGTVQVSYGLIGLVLFIVLLVTMLKDLGSRHIHFLRLSIVLAIIVYGASHNGLRNTLSWIIFALLAAWGTLLESRQTANEIISQSGSPTEEELT